MTLDELIDGEIAAVAGRSHMADLWSREVRYLPEQVRREIRAMMRETARAYLAPLQASRPELFLAQAEMIAWSVQSVLSCLGRESVRLPSAGGQALVRGAVRALPAVSLEWFPSLSLARAEPTSKWERRRPGWRWTTPPSPTRAFSRRSRDMYTAIQRAARPRCTASA
jgi:hypothetical protein